MQARLALQLSVEKKIGLVLLAIVGPHRVGQRGLRIGHVLRHHGDADHVDALQLLADAGEQFDVGHGGRPRLAGLRIDPENGVMSGRDFRFAVAQHEREPAVAVEDLKLRRRGGQGVFQRGAGESHDAGRLVHRQTLLLEKLQHRRMENLDSALGQDIHGRLVNLLDFLVGKTASGASSIAVSFAGTIALLDLQCQLIFLVSTITAA